jgi:uncharacterized protein HemY
MPPVSENSLPDWYRIAQSRLKRIEELEAKLAETEAKFDLEHEAYMDLFHQLSEYERKELAQQLPSRKTTDD